jgi:virginiamycin B lyase
MTVSSDGALWVTEASISAIARIDAAGHVRQYRIPGSSVDPDGILQGPDGRMWFVGFEVLGQVDLSGRMTGWQTGNGTNILPSAITIGPDGAVWFTGDTGPNPTISRVSNSQGPVTVAVLPNSNFVYPARSIAAGPDNAVWFSEVNGGYGRDAIGRVTANGRYTAWPLPSATIPQSIVAGPDHAMWFTERTGIGRITSVGTITNFPIQSNGRPNDIIRGSDGALWFTTSTQVGRITTAGHITTWSIPGAKSLSSIVAAPGGGFWLADEQASTIRRFTPAR